MKTAGHKKKLEAIFNQAPELKLILYSKESMEIKRTEIRDFLSGLLIQAFSDNPQAAPLEWILVRDSIIAFRNILSLRSENLVGFSFLQYLEDLIHKKDLKDVERPSPGFLEEINHLMKGLMGKSDLYQEKAPAFLKYQGQKAARLRSKDLSKMARQSQNYISRYLSGLDKEVVRQRSENKSRIMKYFGSTEAEWNDWRWHIRHIIRDADTLAKLIRLTPEEYQAVKLSKSYKSPFGITPHYLALMDPDPESGKDRAVRAQVIPSLHYLKGLKANRENSEKSMDFMLEGDTSPIEGITRRYPEIVILKPVLTCPQICVYCQRNWEIEEVYSPNAALSKKKLQAALEWIKNTPEISEVLITGGDPLILEDDRLEEIIAALAAFAHVERIRIGTRTLVTLPQRITDNFVRMLNRFHIPGEREIVVVTHFEHPYELSPESQNAIQKIRQYGMVVYNQMVYTYYNSRKFEAVALRKALRLAGVIPYYTFNTKGKEETIDFRVPIPRLLQEQHEEARLMPGTLRTDETVFNVPKLGKNYLRARQHRDVISILPDGRRVYEFHPWEKKLALVDTYLYTDVSIYDYLKRLKADGENLADYQSIWYYY
ncbi:MAG: KamA family radical SAM protein [Proteobacteria bacterium]|nr:KamA family radical SAM protein [Pseudomonadota bacterium]MBU4469590.1 KamA family radical SAM protein [Pseudomonadota bacterium]MCG2753268.1 KamA family radical SAM protein [Desulfobacteraceae bacterium]